MIDFLLEKYNELGITGVNGSIIAILAVFAFLGFIKGAVKMVFLVCMLGGAAFAAYWGCENGLAYIQQHWQGVPEISGNVIGGVCGVVTFYILYKIFDFITNPFEENALISKFGFGIPAAVLSTAVAAGIVWFGVNQLRDRGTQDEMKYWISQNSDKPLSKYPTLAKLQHKFEESSIGQKISNVYRMHDNNQHNLAKLVVIASTSREKIESLYQDPHVRKLMNNPKVMNCILNSPEVKQSILENDPKAILSNPELHELLKDPIILADLSAVTSSQLR